MKKFNFLFKPIFFIFSLLFATWLMLEIEKISPSGFGGRKSHTNQQTHNLNSGNKREDSKKYLQNLFTSYKAGMIDSISLDKKLSIFLDSTKSNSAKQK